MKAWVKENIHIKAWGVFAFTTVVSIWGWSRLGVELDNPYRLFPLLGLLAFGTMWGHYVVLALRTWSGADKEKLGAYSTFTHWFVFVTMLLHPTILIINLQQDGLGLPPESYKVYVGEAMVKFIFLGMLSLIAFLLYEARKVLMNKPTIWKVVLILNHLAMVGVLIHGAKLGSSIQQAPLKYVWPAYAVSLLAIYVYLAYKKKLV